MATAPSARPLHLKQILLGVTGGIASYKSAELVRRLQDAGAIVRVIMTSSAEAFVGPLTFQALSGNPVHTDLLDPEAEAGMGHIELARWADCILIAPATANTMAKLAQGMGDDLLTTVCLATAAPLLVAPAMNQGMWGDKATQANVDTLRARDIPLFGPGSGSQACGDVGSGRMLEPTELVSLTEAYFSNKKSTQVLSGKKVVITAGPTREAIDPVRYISNHSSGKMGYALAEAAQAAGAETIIISGPVSLPAPKGVHIHNVDSALDMHTAVFNALGGADIFIAAAAVADYRPIEVAPQKIKKHAASMHIELVKNPDILAEVAALDRRPLCVGFAAESENLLDNARKKLDRKKLDLIVANDISKPDIGFNQDNNEIVLLSQTAVDPLPKDSKVNLAKTLIDRIATLLPKK